MIDNRLAPYGALLLRVALGIMFLFRVTTNDTLLVHLLTPLLRHWVAHAPISTALAT